MAIPDNVTEIAGHCLLFLLVFGMSATVDIGCLLKQLRNRKAIISGLILQFVVLPFLGFLAVTILQMDNVTGITLLVITSSPGGSYSNWWCSVFNADLALSVTMTAISTIVAMVMLPLNLMIYSKLAFNQADKDFVHMIDFGPLFTSLVVVFAAISLGVVATDKIDSHNFNLQANRFGNFAGVALLIFSAVISNANKDAFLWQRSWKFYVGVAAPCVVALLIANIVTTYTGLKKPERFSSSIECCYQNTGIATSVALSMFNGNALSEAMGVPFYYGIVEISVLGLYCIGAWKAGWTKAPPEEPFWRVLSRSYEVAVAETLEKNQTDVEVKLTEGIEIAEEDEEYVHVPGCGTCLVLCHNPCTDEFEVDSVDNIPKMTPEEKLRAKRGPKKESSLDVIVQPKYLKSLGYKVKDDTVL
mmetsp:Transcript_15888/g.33858  ORF Transcript_15888/g.33858 Transcript_15888/m.33858 type:complete len:416 (+) Transcript_15888:217-1464(+)